MTAVVQAPDVRRHPLRESPAAVALVALFVGDAVYSAWDLWRYPETFAGAYEWALDVVPVSWWPLIWLTIGATMVAGALSGRRWLIMCALGGYALACMVFAISIGWLVFAELPGAGIGARKWLITAMSALILLYQLPNVRELVHVRRRRSE